eukprot:CAMPEP_0183804326 /NCGR_PEP_ID=MMETSP0803_2-20130417/34951_1 /TAXON_ID=195967 /ORGANISM="Crustomastix stigmata, Strain CCMP3273" /LENGTH=48 /DNA_ID= /DNA_START= /DNA_END= /DNA_ORIENTATION=
MASARTAVQLFLSVAVFMLVVPTQAFYFGGFRPGFFWGGLRPVRAPVV